MSKHTTLYLTPAEILKLEKLVRSGNAPARTQTKARLLLLTDRSTGMARNDAEVAEVLGVSTAHVGRIRRIFIKDGMDISLYDHPRSGSKPKITGDIEAKLTMLACSNPPEGHSRWTLQLLADRMIQLHYIDSISRVAVGYCFLNSPFKPWRLKSWCIGKPSGRYVANMEDVLDVYERAYDPQRPVVCLDETSKELRSTQPGSIVEKSAGCELEDYEYERHGTRNLFLWVEPLAGRRHVQVTQRRTLVDFAEVLRQLVDEDYPHVERIVLVTDNLNTHTHAALYERFEPEEARRISQKIEWHYTPEHGVGLTWQRQNTLYCLGNACPDVSLMPKHWPRTLSFGNTIATQQRRLLTGSLQQMMRESSLGGSIL